MFYANSVESIKQVESKYVKNIEKSFKDMLQIWNNVESTQSILHINKNF